jgi:hypothetical protein
MKLQFILNVFICFVCDDRFGQPPHDLVQQMAPGLEFDEEGMPKMDGNDSGLPFPMGNEECSIM